MFTIEFTSFPLQNLVIAETLVMRNRRSRRRPFLVISKIPVSEASQVCHLVNDAQSRFW
jgi:hypothetical protein